MVAAVSLKNRLAAHVRRLREEREWTQEELADKAGLDVRVIQRAESAESSSFATAERLAIALSVDPSELFQPAPRPSPRGPGRPQKRTRAG